MMLRLVLSPLAKIKGPGGLCFGGLYITNTPIKVEQKPEEGSAPKAIPKSLSSAFETVYENKKIVDSLRTYFAKWKADAESSETLLSGRQGKLLEPAPLPALAGVPAEAESAGANQRTISLIAGLALTIFVIANRKKLSNNRSVLNFLNRNPVVKA